MKLLIDIGHPAHVHLFKNFAHTMQGKNHTVLFTCREKEMTEKLLAHYQFQYVSFGKPYCSITGKIKGLFKFNVSLLKTARRFKPDIFLSHGSMYAAHVSSILSKPHISMEDTGNKEQIRFYKPFTDVILTSTSFKQDLGKKQIRYNGYHELAYLHPNTFNPDKSIIEKLGVADDQAYVILRFVSWNATHDKGHEGISLENKIQTVREFSKYAKVFISSEAPLPEELEQYRFSIEPQNMHDAMAFASLLYGESGTMASESAMLGVPAVFLDDTGRYYTSELEEKYRLVFNFTESPEDQEKALQKGIDLLKNSGNGNRDQWQERRQNMLSQNIDVTAFLVWFVENYPKSKTMKYSPIRS